MKKRTSVFARIFAFLALAAAIAAVYFVVNGYLENDTSNSKGQQRSHQATTEKEKPKITSKTYEVKSGDTLSRISYLSGVPVTRLKELNPDVDPLGLIEGEVLKLR